MMTLGEGTGNGLTRAFEALGRKARAELSAEGFRKCEILKSLDLRYAGQSFELRVPFRGLRRAAKDFHSRHAARYGHSAEGEPLEIVTVRLRAVGRVRKPALRPLTRGGRDPRRALIGRKRGTAVFDRPKLAAGNRFRGPCSVVEEFATTYVPAGWRGEVDRWGNLVLA